ncbi:MAG TPA: transketolase [Anaeromyxobacter sp.]|nr:transketolase [Anaeromyxobacter sp.]
MIPQMDRPGLEALARNMRRRVLETIHRAGAGHIGGSLSEMEILVELYFSFLRLDPRNPGWEDRDRFILSKGHASAGYYAVLSERGFFPLEVLRSYEREGGSLQAHPDMRKCPGVDYSTGSLGQGLSIGIGIALGGMLRGQNYRTVVLLGDGECQEGQVWEAAMFAGTRRVRRLIAIVDSNGVQLSTTVREGMSLEPFDRKWAAFNWRVMTVDGHNLAALHETLREAGRVGEEGPVAILARTVKGKGVSFMENRYEWHGRAPNDAELARALKDLEGGGE